MKKIEAKVKTRVAIQAEVVRQIRQHCRTSMKAEVCGVLIGTEHDRTTSVEACIAGLNAAQGGAHVTFTQDTWEHIYRVKDEKFPNERIVGWYHSHPGFGVFLSEHDLFIQQNFFSSPQQIAWVFDPHTDEEGCFGWNDGKVERLEDVSFRFEQPLGENIRSAEAERDDKSEQVVEVPRTIPKKRSVTNIILTALTYVLAFGAGGYAGLWYLNGHFVLLSQDDAQRLLYNANEMAREIDACAQRLKQYDKDGGAAVQDSGSSVPKKEGPSGVSRPK